MKPLIQITTVPISYELKVQKAQVERRRSTAQLEISREKGGLQIKNQPIKVCKFFGKCFSNPACCPRCWV